MPPRRSHHGDVLKTEQPAAVLRSPQVGNVKTWSKKGAQIFTRSLLPLHISRHVEYLPLCSSCESTFLPIPRSNSAGDHYSFGQVHVFTLILCCIFMCTHTWKGIFISMGIYICMCLLKNKTISWGNNTFDNVMTSSVVLGGPERRPVSPLNASVLQVLPSNSVQPANPWFCRSNWKRSGSFMITKNWESNVQFSWEKL